MSSSPDLKAHQLFIPVWIFSIALLWPLAWVVWNGWTLTGVYEESLGYRYFFSLRQVFEPDKFVFLPQGHLPSILYRLIQRVLSLFYEPETLWPRIDVFAYLAVFLAHVGTIAVFAWVLKPLRCQVARVLSAVFFSLVYYLPGWNRNVVQILNPDYSAWVLLIALVGAGLITRWCETRDWRVSQSVILGVYIGVALGVKLTLLVFPATVGLILVLGSGGRFFRSFLMGSLAVGIGIVLWALILLIYNFGDLNFIRDFFVYLNLFLTSNVELYSLTYVEFFQQIFLNASWEVVLLVLSPVLILLCVICVPSPAQTRVLVSLLVGSIVYVEVIFLRFTPETFFEAGVYTIMGFWSLAYVLFRDRSAAMLWTVIAGLISIVLVGVPILRGLPQALPMYMHQIKENHMAGTHLRSLLSSKHEPIAFLIPNNSYRLLSIDSAIFKGGGAIYGGEFPDSPFIKKLFPDRTYFYGNPIDFQVKPANLLDYRTIVFTIRKSPGKNRTLDDYVSQIPNRVRELENYYNTTLDSHNCGNWVDFGSRADPRLVVVCDQRKKRLQEARQSNGLISLKGHPGYWYSTAGDEKNFGLNNGFVYDDGMIFRIVALENDAFRFTNVGPWNALSRKLMGLVGVYHNGQWRLDLEGWDPVNTNTHFISGGHEDPIPGYWISPGEIDATVSQLQDQTGSFVRITAHSLSDYMVLNSQSPLPTLTGEPISIRAQIRVPRRRDVSLTITDVTNNKGQSASHQVRAEPLPDEWTSITVRASNVSYPDSGDNYAVGLADVKPGDYFDIRELSVFVGVLP